MDTEGARALAERIASGPPQEEGAEQPAPRPREPRRKVEPRRKPKPTSDRVEIVYVKPAPAPRREVRIYVRGSQGELERRS